MRLVAQQDKGCMILGLVFDYSDVVCAELFLDYRFNRRPIASCQSSTDSRKTDSLICWKRPRYPLHAGSYGFIVRFQSRPAKVILGIGIHND